MIDICHYILVGFNNIIMYTLYLMLIPRIKYELGFGNKFHIKYTTM